MWGKQRNIKSSKESFREAMQKWHLTLRERNSEDFDEKWGLFLPSQRFNVDQVHFFLSSPQTGLITNSRKRQAQQKVWIQQPGCGLEKRQYSIQISLRPEDTQPKIAIIFRGKGRVSQDEEEAWHPDVDVYFQDNAWANTKFSVDWVRKNLHNAVVKESRFVLFCYNLAARQSDQFKQAVADLGGVVWFGVPNATDLWQHVDSGNLIKVLTKQEQHQWLDCEEHADRWYGNTEKFSVKERRILITHWVRRTYNKVPSGQYSSFIWRMFEQTGCLITADGPNDHLIAPEGLESYKVHPPMPIEATNAIPVSNVISPTTTGDDEFEFEDDDDKIEETQ